MFLYGSGSTFSSKMALSVIFGLDRIQTGDCLKSKVRSSSHVNTELLNKIETFSNFKVSVILFSSVGLLYTNGSTTSPEVYFHASP